MDDEQYCLLRHQYAVGESAELPVTEIEADSDEARTARAFRFDDGRTYLIEVSRCAADPSLYEARAWRSAPVGEAGECQGVYRGNWAQALVRTILFDLSARPELG